MTREKAKEFLARTTELWLSEPGEYRSEAVEALRLLGVAAKDSHEVVEFVQFPKNMSSVARLAAIGLLALFAADPGEVDYNSGVAADILDIPEGELYDYERVD